MHGTQTGVRWMFILDVCLQTSWFERVLEWGTYYVFGNRVQSFMSRQPHRKFLRSMMTENVCNTSSMHWKEMAAIKPLCYASSYFAHLAVWVQILWSSNYKIKGLKLSPQNVKHRKQYSASASGSVTLKRTNWKCLDT